MWIFLFALIGLTIWSFKENLSLIPLWISQLFIHDVKRLELDLFYCVVVNRFNDLLWL
jgi:hypothetical protein